MRRILIMGVFVALSSLLFISCDGDVPFTVAERYFVKNNVEQVNDPKFTTAEEFDSVFGTAAVMGANGKPTQIDFATQYAIAVVVPETDSATTITPVSLKRQNGKLIFSYKIEIGEKQTYTMRPCLIILVDKNVSGEVVLNEIN